MRFFTLIGGLTGTATGFFLTIWSALKWGLVTGGKPVVSIPPFVVIAFELTILLAACAAVAAFVVGGSATRRIAPAAYEPSFSDARFGLLLECPPADAPAVGELLTRSGAAAWRIV